MFTNSWTYSREERSGEFPFALGVQFKLAIAFTDNEFRFAVNGKRFGTFLYRSKNVLERLNGAKVIGSFGLNVEVTSVDHMDMANNECTDFEQFSHYDIQIM